MRWIRSTSLCLFCVSFKAEAISWSHVDIFFSLHLSSFIHPKVATIYLLLWIEMRLKIYFIPLQEASLALSWLSPVLVPMAQSIGPFLSQIASSPTIRMGVFFPALHAMMQIMFSRALNLHLLFLIITTTSNLSINVIFLFMSFLGF